MAMEMNKYALSLLHKIEKKEYIAIKNKALNTLKINDIYKWSKVKVEANNVLPTVVNRVAYPFAFLLFFMMSVEMYHAKELKKSLEIEQSAYLEIKHKNDDIREKINNQNEKKQKWISFAQRELPYADPLESFMAISKAFTNKAFTFKSFSIVGSKVKLTVQSKKDFIDGVTILNQIKGLKSVVLKSSSKKRETASYEATLEKGPFW